MLLRVRDVAIPSGKTTMRTRLLSRECPCIVRGANFLHGARQPEDANEVHPNPLVEQEITHLSRVMRAFVFGRTPAGTTYWQNRLDALFESRHLTDYQRHWVRDLMRELSELRGYSPADAQHALQ